jgi:hypothetical protein
MGACEVPSGTYFVFSDYDDAEGFYRDLQDEVETIILAGLEKEKERIKGLLKEDIGEEDLKRIYKVLIDVFSENMVEDRIPPDEVILEGYHTGLKYVEEKPVTHKDIVDCFVYAMEWMEGEYGLGFSDYTYDELKSIISKIKDSAYPNDKKIKELAKENNALGKVEIDCFNGLYDFGIIEEYSPDLEEYYRS